MNFSIIKRVLGWILLFEAIFFLVPMITAVVYRETAFFSFMITMLICILLGSLCLIGKPKNNTIYAKEGFVIVALCWVVLSLFGALPFVFSGAIPNYIDALFETVSGFTTTGSSVIPSTYANGLGVEGLPKCILMWRSFMHWIGGMGVLVFIIAFLPLSGARNLHIMKAESPGPVVSKIVPKVRTTALILYVIYSVLTIVQFIFLICGGMPIFDAINTSFATAGTGGFSFKSDGFAGYSSYIQIVVTVFMLVFSINFNSYYMLAKGRWKEIITAEVKWFLIIVATAIGLITLNVFLTDTITSFGGALKHTAFSVASIISTTGFATEDFNLWPSFSKAILVLIMFVGACAGSTGGGMKVSRFVMYGKGAINETGKMLHPKQIKRITVDGRVVEDDVIRSIYAYLIAYIAIFVVSLLIISLDGKDMVTNFSSVATTLNNVGPGLEQVGPMGSFANFSWWSKLVFIFDMLAGRLEVFPMLLLFAPATWRK
ncbi:MAG: TrkH family potassium uptake protein [Clostridia bacterium]|nr:TrkH family potassium uptake protein [Clostridia bacterium]